MNDNLLTEKVLTGENVLRAAIARIEWIFETFPSVCLSFSGGKDSTVLFHLLADVARRKKRRFSVLFIDWEAQYQCTIEHIQKMREMYHDVTETFYWVALPLTTVNGVSQFQPEWICWEPGVTWVRQPPEEAITDMTYFPFYRYAMTFEEFVPAFSSWFADNKCGVAVLTGVRADESLNRFMGLVSQRKLRYADDKPWTTAAPGGHSWYIYPIYDWKVADIWTWYANHQQLCNPLYNIMYQAGVPLRHMRICEPFGPEQRQGLWLYHVIEPDRWAAMCARVSGVKSGGIYAGHDNHFYGHRKILKPEHLDWQEYALLLLNSMPEKTAEHYRNKIAIYLHWYQKKGIEVPQTQQGDIGAKDIPSWRRICKVLLNNDYWCRALSFSPTKAKNYQRYNERIKGKRQEWGILCNND